MTRFSFCIVNWGWRARPADLARSSRLHHFVYLLNKWGPGVYGRYCHPYTPHLPQFIETASSEDLQKLYIYKSVIENNPDWDDLTNEQKSALLEEAGLGVEIEWQAPDVSDVPGDVQIQLPDYSDIATTIVSGGTLEEVIGEEAASSYEEYMNRVEELKAEGISGSELIDVLVIPGKIHILLNSAEGLIKP